MRLITQADHSPYPPLGPPDPHQPHPRHARSARRKSPASLSPTPSPRLTSQIKLLGDADSIVTYLSDQLGWTIPPPKGEAKPLAITPDDAVWITGEGEWEHLHMLRSRAEREAMALSGQTIRLHVGGESDDESGSGMGEEGERSEGEEDEDEEDEGGESERLRPPNSRRSSSPSDRSDRPAKRSRVGSPASGESEVALGGTGP